MNWLVHDHSLNGQYITATAFLSGIEELLRLRTEFSTIRDGLRCSRLIGDRPATQTQSFRQVVQSSSDRILRQQILQWVVSKGPFIDENSEVIDENYFEYKGLDVTNEGAGEAARCKVNGLEATTFSFLGGGSDYSPLSIDHGLPEDRIGIIELVNIWNIEALRITSLAALPVAVNWKQAIEQARVRFPNLFFSQNLMDYLRRETFTFHLVEAIFSKLAKLQEFVESRNLDGTNSPETDRLIAAHFAGEKSWFTDESDTNKTKFKNQLTFTDPHENNSTIFCPFHGKIKTPQYRIHFPWPLLKNEKQIRIVYIGPKITKD